jgi:hypothetical protein
MKLNHGNNHVNNYSCDFIFRKNTVNKSHVFSVLFAILANINLIIVTYE